MQGHCAQVAAARATIVRIQAKHGQIDPIVSFADGAGEICAATLLKRALSGS
jgi:hypothetical protein